MSDDSSGNGLDTSIASGVNTGETASLKNPFRDARSDAAWILELDGTGDLTMEQMAAVARMDLFSEVFGRDLIVRPVGVMQ